MKTNTPKFQADRYRDARPLYPRSVFRLLERAGLPGAPIFLDLACGTGQSTRSFLNLGITSQGFATDHDELMLEEARLLNAGDFPNISFVLGAAEAIPLPDASLDLVLIGSAIHWFDLERASVEIARVLKPGGTLLVFEYQFPKCLDDPELAETVRRRFNLEWKAPVQKPRGTLSDLVAPFQASGLWTIYGEDRPEWKEALTLDAFLGHLYSQSRYLHAEAAAPAPVLYREAITQSFAPFFAQGPLHFDLKPRAIGLKRGSGARKE